MTAKPTSGYGDAPAFAGDAALRAKAVKAALLVHGRLLATRRAQADERWEAYLATVRSPRFAKLRRNRPDKMLDRLLCKGRFIGIGLAIARSGLWRKTLRTGAGWPSREWGLFRYALAGPNPSALPRSLFDQGHYLKQTGGREGLAPLAHYLIMGDQAGLLAHPLLATAWYRANNMEGLSATGLTALQHFVAFGAAQGRNPHPLFDLRHYVGQLPHSDTLGLNPLVHYLRIGWREGRNPHPLFANDWYLQRYPDVAETMTPPLLHYVCKGAADGLDPHPLFSSGWYALTYPKSLARGGTPLEHFVLYGAGERTDPNPHFSTEHYLREAPHLQRSSENPLVHYMGTGAWAGLSPHPDFDPIAWLVANPGSLGEDITPLEYWRSVMAG